MKAKKIMKLINDIESDHGGGVTRMKFVPIGSIDMKEFKEQEGSYDGYKKEYVWQSGCADYGYHGQVAIPVGPGVALRFNFTD